MTAATPVAPGFSHETATYRGEAGFLDLVVPFVRAGLAADETVVVVEPRWRLEQLRVALAGETGVDFYDMAEVGANPARIIAVWEDAVAEAAASGRRLRGVGEPAFPGRTQRELAECHVHEVLLDTAFGGGPAWRLLCPYDEVGLPRGVCAAARASHPFTCAPGGPEANAAYAGMQGLEALATPLPPPAEGVLRGDFRAGDLPAVRRTVAQYARSCGLSAEQAEVLELAASELATNSVRHGGGTGQLAMWREPDAAVVEFRDAGTITDPLVGRRRPDPRQDGGGRGLYLVNQLCDLVQLRTSELGTTVRVITRL